MSHDTPIKRLTDAIYDEFAAPIPYQPMHRVSYREYTQVVDALVGSILDPNVASPPPEVLFADAAHQAPPLGDPSPLGPIHPPIQPIRCASHTVSGAYVAHVVRSCHIRCV